MSRYLTPPEIAEQLGVEPQKVRGWIDRGELVAVNLADRPNGRPRYKVSEDALAEFLNRRSTRPPERPTRPKKPAAVTSASEFFKKWGD